MRKKGTIVFLLAVLCLAGTAQIPVSEQFHLDVDELRQHLVKAPLLHDVSTQTDSPVKILLPTPDGTLLTFQIWEDPILSPALQREYPNCRTYSLEGEGEAYRGRMMLSPSGLDAVVLCGEQILFIEAVDAATDLHRVYYWKLGSSYLSFDLSQTARATISDQAIRLAVLVDQEYAQFHHKDLAHAIFASVNGVNAFLQLSQGIHLDLHYFATVDEQQVLACEADGFQGRTAESIKFFGDQIASGQLSLADFDLGHLFSGRGYGGSALAGIAGVDAYYDWNEDGIFDGPAKAGGGLGAVRPMGARWWGNLCKEISRQIKASKLELTVQQQPAVHQEVLPGVHLTAHVGNLGHFPFTMKHYSGPGTMGEITFPHLSCLYVGSENARYFDSRYFSLLRNSTFPRWQMSFTGGALWPMWMARQDAASAGSWMLGRRW